MITDKERHERAKNFRDMISARNYWTPGKVGSFVDIDDVLSELLDRRVYDSEVAIDACEALGIADLIDRPTCTIVCECDAYSSWGERIDGMRLYELSCGHQAVCFEKPEYCPKCGAAIHNG
jgi:hypothetical protein